MTQSRIIHGNCIDVMQEMPAGSVDFILTDPPYITRYRDRSGRRVTNDDNIEWLHASFAQARVYEREQLFLLGREHGEKASG